MQNQPTWVLFLVWLGKLSHTPKLRPLHTPAPLPPHISIRKQWPRVLGPEPITTQRLSHVSAADKLCMHEEDLCVTVCMNGCVYLLHVRILGLLWISVSNSPSVLPALHRSGGLKRPRMRTHTNSCMSLHNYMHRHGQCLSAPPPMPTLHHAPWAHAPCRLWRGGDTMQRF